MWKGFWHVVSHVKCVVSSFNAKVPPQTVVDCLSTWCAFPHSSFFHTNPMPIFTLSLSLSDLCLLQSPFFPSSSLLFTSGPYQLPFLLFPMFCTCRENKAKCGGICVANHTSPMDAAMLATANCFTLVGFIQCGTCTYTCAIKTCNVCTYVPLKL